MSAIFPSPSTYVLLHNAPTMEELPFLVERDAFLGVPSIRTASKLEVQLQNSKPMRGRTHQILLHHRPIIHNSPDIASDQNDAAGRPFRGFGIAYLEKFTARHGGYAGHECPPTYLADLRPATRPRRVLPRESFTFIHMLCTGTASKCL